MKRSNFNKKIVCSFIIFLLIFGTRCFSIVCWDSVMMGHLSYFIYGGVLFWTVFATSRLQSYKLPLVSIIVGLLVLHFPCVFSRFLLYGESPVSEIKSSLVPSFSILVFVLLYSYQINPKMLMKYITLVGVVIVVIQIVQILFPDIAIFGVYSSDEIFTSSSSDEISEIRNGIHRFRLESYMITLLCLYYYWDVFLKRKTIQNFFLFALFLVSIYLNLTRQIILAVIVTLFASFFFIKRKSTKLFFVSVAVLGVVALLKFAPVLLSGLFQNIDSEMTSDNIRYVAYSYFISEILSSPVSFLFGHGHPFLLADLQETMRIFSSDVGIIGEWFHYGFFWILLYFFSLYILLIKYRKQVPLFTKLFFLSTFFTSPLIFPYRGGYEYVIWAVALYISSNSILRNKDINVVHHRNSRVQKEVLERGGAKLY